MVPAALGATTGGQAPADISALFQHRHRKAPIAQPAGAGQTRHPGADYPDAGCVEPRFAHQRIIVRRP